MKPVSSQPQDPRSEPRATFLEAAGIELRRLSESVIPGLPARVADLAWDQTVATVWRRASRGVAGFGDRRGGIARDKVVKYVRKTLKRKIAGAWDEIGRDSVAEYDDATAGAGAEWDPGASENGIDGLLERLDADASADEQLDLARIELTRFRARIKAAERRREETVEAALAAIDASPLDRALVLGRMHRRARTVIKATGLVVVYSRPTPWTALGEAHGISAASARQRFSRVRRRLPPDVQSLVDHRDVPQS